MLLELLLAVYCGGERSPSDTACLTQTQPVFFMLSMRYVTRHAMLIVSDCSRCMRSRCNQDVIRCSGELSKTLKRPRLLQHLHLECHSGSHCWQVAEDCCMMSIGRQYRRGLRTAWLSAPQHMRQPQAGGLQLPYACPATWHPCVGRVSLGWPNKQH